MDRVGEIEECVRRIFELVRDAVGAATEIFLTADRPAARALAQRDDLIDDLHRKADELTVDALMFPEELDPATRERLLLVLRVLPELERSGDLAEHIASHAVQGLAQWLSPRARQIVAQMGDLDHHMWELAADAFAHSDESVADLLRRRDDEIDDLHVSLTAELAAGQVSVPVAIEMALVARYFERLGDHAVNVTRRLRPTPLQLAGAAR